MPIMRKGRSQKNKRRLAQDKSEAQNGHSKVVAEVGDHTLEQAVAIFKRHRIKGLENRESIRLAMKAGSIPHKRLSQPGAPFRISLETINTIIAERTEQAQIDHDTSPHKRLMDHYSASPLHTPVSAITEGIVTSIHEAVIVYRLFKKHQPEVRALNAFKKHAEWESKQVELAKQEPPCEGCKRSYFDARRESARVVAEATGRAIDPWLHTGTQFGERETNTLSDYREKWFCSICRMWNVAAPIDEMKKVLSSEQPAESAIASTAETG